MLINQFITNDQRRKEQCKVIEQDQVERIPITEGGKQLE